MRAHTISVTSEFILQETHYKYRKYKAPPNHSFASIVMGITLFDGRRRETQLRLKGIFPGVHLSLPLNRRNLPLLD